MNEQAPVNELIHAFSENRPADEFWPRDSWWLPTTWDAVAQAIEYGQLRQSKFLLWLAEAQPALALRLIRKVSVEIDLDLRQAIVASARSRTADQNALSRAMAYNVLGELDADLRFGVRVPILEGIPTPEFAWINIPAGHFLSGDQKEKRRSAPIRIAAYPLTNAQYEGFVQVGGYLTERYWTVSGWEWRQTYEIVEPLSYGEPFTIGNYPRVGISWYEAIAYTNWLNEFYANRGIQCKVRLASEFEFERAIRGDNGNHFAYGDEIDYERCNGGGTGIGSTCAVGIFPAGCSPHGLYDAIGNIWEWTLSTPDDEWGGDLNADSSRVIRGGAWNYFGNYLRCSFRYWYAPVSRNSVIGLRLASSASN